MILKVELKLGTAESSKNVITFEEEVDIVDCYYVPIPVYVEDIMYWHEILSDDREEAFVMLCVMGSMIPLESNATEFEMYFLEELNKQDTLSKKAESFKNYILDKYDNELEDFSEEGV